MARCRNNRTVYMGDELRVALIKIRNTNNTTFKLIGESAGYRTNRLAAIIDDPDTRMFRTRREILRGMVAMYKQSLLDNKKHDTEKEVLDMICRLDKVETLTPRDRHMVNGTYVHWRSRKFISYSQAQIIRKIYREIFNT